MEKEFDYNKLKRIRKVGKSFSLDKEVWDEFKEFCKSKDAFPSALINELMKRFLLEEQEVKLKC